MLVISLFLPVLPVSPPGPRALTQSQRLGTTSATTTRVTPAYSATASRPRTSTTWH